MGSIRKYVAECVGTAVLVLMGCGSAVFLGATGANVLIVALAFGLSIVAMAYVIGGISGCHVNPAVSLAMWMNKKISGRDFIGYVVAQVIGGIAGAALLKAFSAMAGVDKTGGLGSNGTETLGIGGSLLLEVVLTFIFVLVILGVTSDAGKGSVAGIVIGLTLTFVHIVGIPLTGTSVNPARSIGPALMALFAGNAKPAQDLWVFILAPLVGAALAYGLFAFLRGKKKA